MEKRDTFPIWESIVKFADGSQINFRFNSADERDTFDRHFFQSAAYRNSKALAIIDGESGTAIFRKASAALETLEAWGRQ